ncbi:MAG: cytidine deaminase [Acidimicrobiales bacterium]
MIDWAALKLAATAVAQNAYAPYSKFRVGAAAFTTDGRLITGCNVENVSYGLGLCAECALVSALHSTGGGRLAAVAVVSGTGEPCTPCGRCRQLLVEHGGIDCLIDCDGSIKTIGDILPDAFTPERLNQDL